jgi:hypothetical protein
MSDLVKSLREACEDECGVTLPWIGPPEGLTVGDVKDSIERIEALEAALRQAREALIASDRDSDYEIVDAINDLLNDTPEKQK